MPFKKGEGGRPKGAQNKTTLAAKEAFQAAFDEMGGYQALLEWAMESKVNRSEFYKLYARLIPHDVTSGDKPVSFTLNAPPPED